MCEKKEMSQAEVLDFVNSASFHTPPPSKKIAWHKVLWWWLTNMFSTHAKFKENYAKLRGIEKKEEEESKGNTQHSSEFIKLMDAIGPKAEKRRKEQEELEYKMACDIKQAKKKRKKIKKIDKTYYTYGDALIGACKCGTIEEIKALLDMGADPNYSLSKKIWESTPLVCTLYRKHSDSTGILKLLIAYGASARDYRSQSLYVAKTNKSMEKYVDLLISAGADESYLSYYKE